MNAPIGSDFPPSLLKKMIWWFNENRFNNGNEITRKQLMEDFWEENQITVDMYRNYLTKAGYLEWIKRGVYRRVKKIPVSLTEKEIRKQAYDI